MTEEKQMSVRIENRPTVVGLPDTMYVEYFGLLPDGTQYVIYRPREGWEYKDFRCLLKPTTAAEFALHEILDIKRFRDGGTTDIKIQGGDFHFPAPFHNERATFGGNEVTQYAR
jgi:hypothetical protein